MIEIRKVSHGYAGKDGVYTFQALADVSLTIEAGTFLFVPGAAEIFPISLVLEHGAESEEWTKEGTPFLKHGERLLAKIGWERSRGPTTIKLTTGNEGTDVCNAG